jgi:DNA-binding response OmpR family regulator
VLLSLGGASVPGLPAALERAGCVVEPASDLAEARRILTTLGPRAAAVVDGFILPDLAHGALAALGRQDAVVVCTPRVGSDHRSGLLQLGADHVLCRPSVEEVVAALTAVLRRAGRTAQEPAADVIAAGDLSVHLATRMATVAGRPLRLTSLEFDLLTYFVARPGQSITRERLLRDVWGYDIGGLDTVTVHVRRLRTKIELDPSRPQHLQTVWGVGYRLSASPASESAPAAPLSAAAV